MAKKASTNVIKDKSVLDLLFFKDQISFHTSIPQVRFSPIEVKSDLLKGLFKNKTTQQLYDAYENLVLNKKKNIILELPTYAGKTLISFALAYHYAHNLGKNAVIVYPTAVQRDIAFEFHQKHLAEKYFNKFPNFIIIKNEDDFKNEYLYYPQVYITDIYSIHKFFIHSIREDMFWEQLQLCVLEDCNNYTEVFGSNSAYVIRRLLSKLDYYNKDYQLLCTTRPFNNRIEFVANLTGVKEFSEVANVDSAYKPEYEVFNWYPPIIHLNYDNSGVTVNRENFFSELDKFIKGLLETGKQEDYIAVLWEKYLISSDDIANYTRKYANNNDENKTNIFFGNNLNEIRLNLLRHSKKLDLSDLRSIVIVGNKKPIKFYLTELVHIGINPKQIYFFDTQSPSLQYQIMSYLKNPAETSELSQTEKPIRIDLNDPQIINQQWSFLKDENPYVTNELLKKYFPGVFISTIGENNLDQRGSFLILNKDLRFYPREKRTDEQLHLSSGCSYFTLILIEDTNRTTIGEMVDNEVRAKCYPNNILVYKGNKYFIQNIDWSNKIVNLKEYAGDSQLVYKISNYEFTFTQGYEHSTSTQLNDRLVLVRGNTQVSEQILNLKVTRNLEDYSTVGIANNNSFENVKLNYLEFRFPLQLFDNIIPPEDNQQVNEEEREDDQEQTEQNDAISEEQRRNNRYNTIFPILHTFSHLLIESLRVNNVLPLDEIKLHIPSTPPLITTNQSDNQDEQPQPEWLFCSVYLIDISNRNADILEAIFQNDINPFLKIMEGILLHCPCEVGSNTCIKVGYCNIENCGINQPNYIINQDNSITDSINRLNKINTLRFISNLLETDQGRIDTYVRWKRSIPERGEGACIFENDKLQEMVRLAQSILTSKGLIEIEKFFNSRFFERSEINQETPLGITRLSPQEIAFRPGLTENELYETIFHEFFHNYEFDTISSKKPINNIHRMLIFFDWDNIDNPQNIPYHGLLVLEGAAVWFSLRMMEFFSDFSYLRYMRTPYTRFMEYRAGLQLMLEVERKNGYKKVFDLLRESFDVKVYQDSFISVVNEEIRNHLSTRNQQDQDSLPILWCLQYKNQLVNINRVTYFLRINIEPRRNDYGIEEMRLKDKRVSHIRREDIHRYATMAINQFIQDAQIITILNKYGLGNMVWNDNNGFICEGCASNCNLFTACMLNGGRKIFKEILLTKFPPPPEPSLLKRISRRFFHRN